MAFLWHQLRGGMTLILHGNPFIFNLTWVTLRIAVVSTALALVVGLPFGLALGLGRFRGRRALQILANAGLALPPVVVGVVVLLLLIPQGALSSLRIEFTLRAVYLVQAVLALPYIVALTPAAIQGLPPGLIAQARALGAGRVQLAWLALREARVGVTAAAIAAMGAAMSEVGAVVIVGGNVQGKDETLASALLTEFTYSASNSYEIAIAIMLLVLIVVLIGSLTVLQQRTGGIALRFRAG
ncbi:MAG: ABC transporter permease [Solirubrobacteraceae bacterium]|jgi:tungstate transport system permease protein